MRFLLLLWKKHYPQVESNVVASIVISVLSQNERKIKKYERKSKYYVITEIKINAEISKKWLILYY